MQRQIDEFDDFDIIRIIIAGDVNAFEILINRYQGHVFSIVRKHIPTAQAEEVAHDVFVRAYQGLGGYSKKSGFKQWLAGIAVRTCYDFWREKYRVKEVPMSQLSDAHREWIENAISDSSGQSYEEGDRHARALEILDVVLARMSAADRMVLSLTYLEGYTHKEAAGLLGLSIANVKIRAHRARKKLHKIADEIIGKNKVMG